MAIFFKNKDVGSIAFMSAYYLVTLACLALSGWALYYAYLYLNLPFIAWIAIYAAVATYLFYAIKTVGRNRGIRRFLFNVALLQFVPALCAILTFVFVPQSMPYEPQEEPLTPLKSLTPLKPLTGSTKVYERRFNDMQDKQKMAALANGLSPFKSQSEIETRYKELRRGKKLVKIESNPQYVVRSLTHSAPYVVPKVEALLEDLANGFQEKTQSKARFVVTSVLRTEEDVKKLRRVNGNASTNSCHCNATTIDISYVRFDDDKIRPRDNYELRLALAQTLHELRDAGRCYVKIERKQYCYHITVR